jgi:hypothetical protein
VFYFRYHIRRAHCKGLDLQARICLLFLATGAFFSALDWTLWWLHKYKPLDNPRTVLILVYWFKPLGFAGYVCAKALCIYRVIRCTHHTQLLPPPTSRSPQLDLLPAWQSERPSQARSSPGPRCRRHHPAPCFAHSCSDLHLHSTGRNTGFATAVPLHWRLVRSCIPSISHHPLVFRFCLGTLAKLSAGGCRHFTLSLIDSDSLLLRRSFALAVTSVVVMFYSRILFSGGGTPQPPSSSSPATAGFLFSSFISTTNITTIPALPPPCPPLPLPHLP